MNEESQTAISPELVRIEILLEEWLQLFRRKNSEYQTGSLETDSELDTGLIGQYSDMYRKMKKLRRPLLFGDFGALSTEQADEIIMDMIGHMFLTLDMLRQGSGRVWDGQA